MSQQQEKRGPGRPRKGQGTQHVDITLSVEVIEALEQVTTNKSRFIDEWLRQHPQVRDLLQGRNEF